MPRIPDFSNRIFPHFHFSNKAALTAGVVLGEKEVVGGARGLQNTVPKRENINLLRLVHTFVMGTRTSPVTRPCPPATSLEYKEVSK